MLESILSSYLADDDSWECHWDAQNSINCQQVQPLLPPGFWHEFLTHTGFHDWVFSSLHCVQDNNGAIHIELELANDNKKALLTFLHCDSLRTCGTLFPKKRLRFAQTQLLLLTFSVERGTLQAGAAFSDNCFITFSFQNLEYSIQNK